MTRSSRLIERHTSRILLTTRFMFAIVVLLGIGCTGSDQPKPDEADSKNDDSVAIRVPTSGTSTVTAAKSTNLTSPAGSSTGNLGPDATPEQVCQRFMDLLQSGNRIAAENLLTLAASTITTKSGLHLEPMGGAASVYSVTGVFYSTDKLKLATVECLVTDVEDGKTFEMPITWLVRKQRIGWRISGVLLELEKGQALDLLSFENVDDVTKMKNLAGGDVLNESDVMRHADAVDPNIK